MSQETPERAKALLAMVAKLSLAPRVIRLAEKAGEDVGEIATEAAVCLADIEESCVTLREVLLPRLVAMPGNSEELEDLLDEIAEEYRHIHYHITDTRLFNHVASQVPRLHAGD